MKLSAILAPLIAAKADHETIMKVVLAFEAEQTDALEKRREADRKRQNEKRYRDKSRDVTLRHSDRPLATRAEDSSSTSSLSVSLEDRAPAAPSKKGSRIPDDFQPDLDWAASQGLPSSQAKFEAAQFTDYWRSKPGKDGFKLDWPGTWRMWVRNALKRQSSQRSASPPIPMKPRNAGEAARLELQRRGEYPDATHHETRYLDQGDGGPGFAGTGIARRLAFAAGG